MSLVDDLKHESSFTFIPLKVRVGDATFTRNGHTSTERH